jgi:hypothetical protein
MLTSNRVAGIVLFSLAACLPGTRIGAFEGTDGARVDKAPLQTFATPRAALQAGIEVFRTGGDASSAIEALNFAARGGEALARWKLAQIYANGDGVPRDDLKAYGYFSQIAASYDEDNPDRRDLAIVSSAFVALGIYNLNGVANSKLAMPTPNIIWRGCISKVPASTRTAARRSAGCFLPPIRGTCKRRLCSVRRFSRAGTAFNRSGRAASCG